MRAEHHNGSDGDSGKDTSDEDGPRTEKTRESLSPPQQFNAPSTLSNSWDKMDLYHDADHTPESPVSTAVVIPSEVAELLRRMPQRPVTDILIQHFFTEANWIYEMVDPITFLEKYNDWWSHACRTMEDVEFAALLLRLCSYAAQFLPSQNYTADTVLGNSLADLRKDCDSTANALASSSYVRDASTSIPRIHQLFFRACYLKNEGDMKRSWDVLSEAIKEAQELGLHLELQKGQGKFTSEYDVELGKRTYWNLWLWDKFMCIVLGRWPLIPDQRCTVLLPHTTVGNAASDVNAPDTFCERRLQIELTRLASEMLSCTDGKQSMDPEIIDQHMRKLNTDLIDKLPPAFRINNPERKWDEGLPNLKRQREMFRISVFATICSLLKPIIVGPAAGAQAATVPIKKLVAKLKISLIEANIQMLDSVAKLHELMGGKQNRFFLLSFFTLEPAALLGMSLLSLEGHGKDGKQVPNLKNAKSQIAENQRYWEKGRMKMEEGRARLKMLSEVSSIARTGLKILETIIAQLDKKTSNKRPNEAPHAKSTVAPAARVPISPVSDEDSARSEFHFPAREASAPHVSTALDGVHLEEAAGLSITPPYSHSERSRNSPPFSMPESWLMMGNWADMEQGPGGQGGAMPSVDWDLNLFETDVLNNHPPASTVGAPSVPWPSYPLAWGLPTTKDSADPSVVGGGSWPLPQTTGEYGGMGASVSMAMGPDVDWNWMGDGRIMGFGE
ncbi:MAG: hypothetical protein LQ352_006330 [Teloschistes flavicans]|nr:MAG: hypothetical protein LQ352_006330 [Teloschistes flavicans]